MRRYIVPMLVACCFCLFASALPAQEEDDAGAGGGAPPAAGRKAPGRGAAKGPAVARGSSTLERALAAAAGKLAGSVYRAEQEKVEGGSFWRIGLVGDDGKPRDVFVDGAGKVVEIDCILFTEDPADQKPATSELLIGSAADIATKKVPGSVTRAEVVERDGQPFWSISVMPKGQTEEKQVVVRDEKAELAPGAAAALESQPAGGTVPTVPPKRSVSLAQAAGVAVRTAAGSPFGVSLVEFEERPVWQVRLSGADGRIYHVTVDAVDGKALQANRVDYSAYYEKSPPQAAPMALDQALRAAGAVVPGDPVEAAAGTARNAGVWNVVVTARQDGKEHEVTVGGQPAGVVAVDGQSMAKAQQQARGNQGRNAQGGNAQGRNAQRPAARGGNANRGGGANMGRINQGLRRMLPQMLGMGGKRRHR